MKSYRFFTTVLAAGLIISRVAVASSDFIILAQPEHYSISNQYEQPLSASEKSAFLPNAPLRVIDQDVVLGDQINKALKFEFQNKSYFLLKDEKGRFTGEKSADARKWIANCLSINDTVLVIKGGVLKIQPIAGAVRTTKAQECIVRIFKLGDRYYVLTAAGYGWSSLEPPAAWRTDRQAMTTSVARADTGLSDEIFAKINQEIAQVNETYRKYFSHFNDLTKTDKTPPEWRCDRDANALRCVLTGPGSDQFGESTKKLVREIGDLLVGSSYRVIGTGNEIIIQKR